MGENLCNEGIDIMKNITRHRGILGNVVRMDNSLNGNPQYKATVDGYTFRTQRDHSHGYVLRSYEGRYVEVEIGTHYRTLQLHAIRNAK
jgi:hypothetical protein